MSEPIGISRPAVSTWDLLRALGFTEDPTLCSDLLPGLSFNFGNFKLSAICGGNRHFVRVILLTGVMLTDESICEVECEIPLEVKSPEQGMAWLAWCLDNHADGRKFEPATAPTWLAKGRLHRHLLPCERSLAAYEARPYCAVKREWARVALKALGELLTTVDDEAPVTLGFDGAVLTIRCAGNFIPIPADGPPWTQQYSIRTGALRRARRGRTGFTCGVRQMSPPGNSREWGSAGNLRT